MIVDDMVWRFQDQASRNAIGRAVRGQGYKCFATGPLGTDKACLLTVEDATVERRIAAAQLIRRLAAKDKSGPTTWDWCSS